MDIDYEGLIKDIEWQYKISSVKFAWSFSEGMIYALERTKKITKKEANLARKKNNELKDYYQSIEG